MKNITNSKETKYNSKNISSVKVKITEKQELKIVNYDELLEAIKEKIFNNNLHAIPKQIILDKNTSIGLNAVCSHKLSCVLEGKLYGIKVKNIQSKKQIVAFKF